MDSAWQNFKKIVLILSIVYLIGYLVDNFLTKGQLF